MNAKFPVEKNIKEWRNEDKHTGVFIVGRSEEWLNNQCSHILNKPEQRKKKQMEIFQANTNDGLVQVIRTQLVTKSSSKNNNTRVLQVDPSSKLETLLTRNFQNLSISDNTKRSLKSPIRKTSLNRVNSFDELNTNENNHKNWNRVSVTRRSLPTPANICCKNKKYSTGNIKSSKSHIYENLPAHSSQFSLNDKNKLPIYNSYSDTNLKKNHANQESLVILKHLNTIKSLQIEGPKILNPKISKKVEFCKTEVHFTPDSGKIEIIETEGKPVRKSNLIKGKKANKKHNSNFEYSTNNKNKKDISEKAGSDSTKRMMQSINGKTKTKSFNDKVNTIPNKNNYPIYENIKVS
ncbi:hypothetical protein ACFFRR_005259 [Megaselia abdita]